MRRSVLLSVLMLVLGAPQAQAHRTLRAGAYKVTLGWVVEPPVSGRPNGLQVTVTDAAARPATRAQTSALSAAVVFGGRSLALALGPGAAAGELIAPLEPTRPGVYDFKVVGTLGGRPVEIAASCATGAFDCVAGPHATQFPVAEPTTSELVSRLRRADARAVDARAAATSGRRLAAASLLVAVLALAGAVTVGRRQARR